MTEQLTPDFYGANEWTPYPFTGPYDDTTRTVIDASITVPPGLQGEVVLMSYLRATQTDPPAMRIICGGEVLVDTTDTVVVTTFGDYQIWQVSKPTTQATLVIKAQHGEILYAGSGYEFVQPVVSVSAQNLVQAILGGATEAAGPGENLTLISGSHLEFETSTDSDGTARITVSAKYRADGPCVPASLALSPSVRRINGVSPDQDGNLMLVGSGIWLVDSAANGLSLKNVGQACCDCDDYVAMFAKAKTTHDRLVKTKAWVEDAQDRYRSLLTYVKFLLRAQIVGGTDGEDTARQDC